MLDAIFSLNGVYMKKKEAASNLVKAAKRHSKALTSGCRN